MGFDTSFYTGISFTLYALATKEFFFVALFDFAVSVEVIGKICLALECTPNDIMEFSNNVTEESTSK